MSLYAGKYAICAFLQNTRNMLRSHDRYKAVSLAYSILNTPSNVHYRELSKASGLFTTQLQRYAWLFIFDPTQFPCSDAVPKFFLSLSSGCPRSESHFMPHHFPPCRLQPSHPTTTTPTADCMTTLPTAKTSNFIKSFITKALFNLSLSTWLIGTECALSLKRLSAGPGFNPQTRWNKLFQDYWRTCFEINFSDRQEGLTAVSSMFCDR